MCIQYMGKANAMDGPRNFALNILCYSVVFAVLRVNTTVALQVQNISVVWHPSTHHGLRGLSCGCSRSKIDVMSRERTRVVCLSMEDVSWLMAPN